MAAAASSWRRRCSLERPEEPEAVVPSRIGPPTRAARVDVEPDEERDVDRAAPGRAAFVALAVGTTFTEAGAGADAGAGAGAGADAEPNQPNLGVTIASASRI